MSVAETRKIGNRTLRFSNLDKPLYPGGFTKGQVLEYYLGIAPVMLPYLRGRAVTLRRFPDGVTAGTFYQKSCPDHRPPWVATARVKSRDSDEFVDHCLLDERAALLWAANLAALEIHVPMARVAEPDRPTAMVFDLDPGPPATIADCMRLGLSLRDFLQRTGLDCLPKTSGSKGLHVYVPLNTRVTFEQTKDFALAIATLLTKQNPKLVTANMSKAQRAGKVFVDWSQNDVHKTTVCAYSLRATEQPRVSTPVTWKEVQASLASKSGKPLVFSPADVLKRVSKLGDLFLPVLKQRQTLPSL
ncbi:MAG TPA: non-homologous end-joining DNA ligase [Tepidisphaeraceae bacterium]|jgi:bifunctional non-homologous end joining protein LigD|nr:non-homologous end-joining DNA ligase [Tepidisphaeraceae bacterium]